MSPAFGSLGDDHINVSFSSAGRFRHIADHVHYERAIVVSTLHIWAQILVVTGPRKGHNRCAALKCCGQPRFLAKEK
jgi:hypothetical protein